MLTLFCALVMSAIFVPREVAELLVKNSQKLPVRRRVRVDLEIAVSRKQIGDIQPDNLLSAPIDLAILPGKLTAAATAACRAA
jgi:hypothetical protein